MTRVGILHTAFIGDLALAGLLVEGLYRAGHAVVLASNGPGLALYAHDPRIAGRVLIRKEKGLKKIRAVWACAHAIREADLDVLLVPHRSLTSALISRLARTRRSIGFETSAGAPLFGEIRPYVAGRHECLRLLDLAPRDLVSDDLRRELEARGAPVMRAGHTPTRFHEAFPGLASRTARYFVVSPGSVWATKRYPASSFARATRTLLAADGTLICVVSGGPSDGNAIHEFLAETQNWGKSEKARVVDASACIPLDDLAAVLAGARLVLANDSAPLHVACAVDTPVVGIFGPTSASEGHGPSGALARLAAYETEHQTALACRPCSKHGQDACPLGHFRCMRDLAPATVSRLAMDLLKSAR